MDSFFNNFKSSIFTINGHFIRSHIILPENRIFYILKLNAVSIFCKLRMPWNCYKNNSFFLKYAKELF